MTVPERQTANLEYLDLDPARPSPRERVLAGLKRPRKEISPEFFYDRRGSELFRRITELPEYYPTRTERSIFALHGSEMARWAGRDSVLIEPGAGDCTKVEALLDHLGPRAYVPLDVSGDFLLARARELAGDFPALPVTAVCADFDQIESLAQYLPPGRRLFFYPGSTLGNLTPDEALIFLRKLRGIMGADGGLLLGLDRHKDPAILEAAYNDPGGVTAAFNLNALRHLNRILPADFDPEAFRHRAFYNRERYRIEMHLESLRDQTVDCAGTTVHFARGETLHTENSCKYTPEGTRALLEKAGLQLRKSWYDERELFGVHYCTP